jgi:hypothetical protein
MKISVISPDLGDACSLYRALGPYRKLQHLFDIEYFAGKSGFFLWDTILNADVVLLQRPYTKQHATIAQCVKACGKKLLVDWDDQIDVVPAWNPNCQAFADCLPNLEAISALADCVTVSSVALKHAAQRWGGKRVELVRNAIDDSLIETFGKHNRKQIIAWRGSNTHIPDVEIAKPHLENFISKGYEVAFFGDRPNWSYAIKHKFFPVSDYCQYMATLDALAPEYMIFTLADHPFNHSRSDIAAQECWTIGAKLIHNNLGEFEGLPERQAPRKLSEMNALRIEILRSLA